VYKRYQTGSMKLYVGRLPDEITHLALTNFFQGFEKSVSFQIRQLRDGETNELITYALVTTTSNRIANKIIAKLNGAPLKGKPVLVREFVPRASGNERRAVDWRNRPWKFFDRRHDDRRKQRQLRVQEELWKKVYRDETKSAEPKAKEASG
jgi:RNA recognition motif-containing protein